MIWISKLALDIKLVGKAGAAGGGAAGATTAMKGKCFHKAQNYFQMTKFHQNMTQIVLFGKITIYGHLGPDFQKTEIFKILFFHVNQQTITLPTSPQPISGDHFLQK